MKKLLQKPAAWGLRPGAGGKGAAAPACAAVSLPDLPADQCVVDAANVLSDDTAAYIDQLNGQLEASCQGAQIGGADGGTTPAAPPREEYALEAFNTWGVGNQDQDNGILLLLVMESPPLRRRATITFTYGDGFPQHHGGAAGQPFGPDHGERLCRQRLRRRWSQTCAAAVADAVADVYGVSLTRGTAAPPPPRTRTP